MAAAFDHIAESYDSDFTHSAIGKAQREQVWRHLPEISAETSCLELNCGTGEDARKMAQIGASVLATDISAEMVAVAKSKLEAFENAGSEVLDIKHLQSLDLSMYNLVFSNFGGLNCLSPIGWKQFAEKLTNGKRGTRLAFVIMGRNCWWEHLYFAFKKQKPWSRKGNVPVSANVGDAHVDTWYYSPKEISRFLSKDFRLLKLRPVGFAVPPSYLESWFSNKAWILNLLKFADKQFFSGAFWAYFADHFYIEFVKQ